MKMIFSIVGLNFDDGVEKKLLKRFCVLCQNFRKPKNQKLQLQKMSATPTTQPTFVHGKLSSDNKTQRCYEALMNVLGPIPLSLKQNENTQISVSNIKQFHEYLLTVSKEEKKQPKTYSTNFSSLFKFQGLIVSAFSDRMKDTPTILDSLEPWAIEEWNKIGTIGKVASHHLNHLYKNLSSIHTLNVVADKVNAHVNLEKILQFCPNIAYIRIVFPEEKSQHTLKFNFKELKRRNIHVSCLIEDVNNLLVTNSSKKDIVLGENLCVRSLKQMDMTISNSYVHPITMESIIDHVDLFLKKFELEHSLQLLKMLTRNNAKKLKEDTNFSETVCKIATELLTTHKQVFEDGLGWMFILDPAFGASLVDASKKVLNDEAKNVIIQFPNISEFRKLYKAAGIYSVGFMNNCYNFASHCFANKNIEAIRAPLLISYFTNFYQSLEMDAFKRLLKFMCVEPSTHKYSDQQLVNEFESVFYSCGKHKIRLLMEKCLESDRLLEILCCVNQDTPFDHKFWQKMSEAKKSPSWSMLVKKLLREHAGKVWYLFVEDIFEIRDVCTPIFKEVCPTRYDYNKFWDNAKAKDTNHSEEKYHRRFVISMAIHHIVPMDWFVAEADEEDLIWFLSNTSNDNGSLLIGHLCAVLSVRTPSLIQLMKLIHNPNYEETIASIDTLPEYKKGRLRLKRLRGHSEESENKRHKQNE
jgi:hypothetical protein